MKFLLLSILLLSCSSFAFSQDEQEKVFPLSALKAEGKLVTQVFPNVPEEVRDFHARGQFRYWITIDKTGKVKEIKPTSEFSKRVDDYLIPTIKSWEFKPLEYNGEKVFYRTMIFVPFCYGSFKQCNY